MRRQGGFTLIEILLAVAILAIVLAMVYTSFDQTSTLAKRVEAVSEEFQGARIAFVKLSSELTSAYGGFDSTGTGGLAGELSGGFVGTDALGPDGQDADGLTFDTMARVAPEDRPGSYHSRISYRMEGDRLLHKEEPDRQDLAAAPAPEWPLVEGLAGFRLRYMTEAGDWIDSWGGEDGQTGLPRAVEVTLLFPAEGAEADADRDGFMALTEIVRVPMGEG
jgi:general secretion pathway protein J